MREAPRRRILRRLPAGLGESIHPLYIHAYIYIYSAFAQTRRERRRLEGKSGGRGPSSGTKGPAGRGARSAAGCRKARTWRGTSRRASSIGRYRAECGAVVLAAHRDSIVGARADGGIRLCAAGTWELLRSVMASGTGEAYTNDDRSPTVPNYAVASWTSSGNFCRPQAWRKRCACQWP
jgi:hypothetical protein